MIRDLAVYRDGMRVDVESVSSAFASVSAQGGFLWLGLVEPSDEEFAEAATVLNLHPVAVEDAVKAHQRPKVEIFGETVFCVLRTVFYDDAASSVNTGEVMLFCGPNFVVTVRHGVGAELASTRAALEATPETLRLGPFSVLHAVVDAVVDDYVRVSTELEHDVSQIEELVFADNADSDAADIYFLKREIIAFKRAVKPLRLEMERIATSGLPGLPTELIPFMRDVEDHVLRVCDAVDGIDELLSGMLAADLSQQQVRQNEDMRRITAWVAVAAVPTMVAGVYGMNFDNMPELRWKYGYFVVCGLLVATCSYLWRRFRKSGWL